MAAKGIPVYSIVLNDDDRTGVSMVSFVESPAIQSNFVALCEQPLQVRLAADGMKQVVTGPVLIPDRNIIRLNEKGEPYYITFSASTIEAISNKFFKKGKGLHKTNSEHEIPLDGNYVVESWIITDPEKDKAAALGLSGLPAGTWMLSYKVDDSAYWKDEILSGKRKGFSLEGMFDYQAVTLAAQAAAAGAMAYTRYMDANLGYTRDQMPQIPQEMMAVFTAYFQAKYGADAVSPTRFKISDLKPAQKEIKEEKVREKIESGQWKDREYLVSKDGHLLDGHHDWAAGLEAGPDQEVAALVFSLPAAQLIEEANGLKITHQEALSAINFMPTTKEEIGPNSVHLEDIQINGGGVVRYNPITRKLYTADGNLLPSGTYSMPDGTTFKVETNQYIYEVSEPVGTKLSAVSAAKQSISISMAAKKGKKPSINKMHKAYNKLKKLKAYLGVVPGYSDTVTEMGEELATATLQDGTPVEIVDETGEVFLLDAEGNRTGAAPDGTHTLGDGSTIEVKDGKLVTEMAAATQTPDANAAAVQELAGIKAALAIEQAEKKRLTAELSTLKEQVQKLNNAPAVGTIENETKLSAQKSDKQVSLADRVFEQALAMSKVTYKENK